MKNLKTVVPAVAAFGMLLVANAQAALPEEIATGLGVVQTDGLALVDLLWPVVIAITTAFILIKLFKRGASKV